MKIFFLLSFLFLQSVLTYGQTLASTQSAPTAPKIFFEYSWLYDANCSNTPERKIQPEWADDAMARTPEFVKVWENAGPVLFGKVFEIFGKGFQRKEVTATLSVCPRTPSYSNPLVLNVTLFLKSYTKPKSPLPDEAFADLVFHEMLHTWLMENMNWPTPLLIKYKNEAPSVRSHLHLMAMQIYIYTLLGRPDLVQMIEVQYGKIPSPVYQRAWEIVSKIEGHEAFITELKNP